MAYNPQAWADNDPNTPLSGARLTNMETGIDQAHDLAAAAQGTADAAASTASTAQADATAAGTAAGAAQADATAAGTAASNAQTTADGAATTAGAASTAASNAQSTADGANTAASNAQTTANTVSAEVVAAREGEVDLAARINAVGDQINQAMLEKENAGVAADLLNTHAGATLPHAGYIEMFEYDTALGQYVSRPTRTRLWAQYAGEPDPMLDPAWVDGDVIVQEGV